MNAPVGRVNSSDQAIDLTDRLISKEMGNTTDREFRATLGEKVGGLHILLSLLYLFPA